MGDLGPPTMAHSWEQTAARVQAELKAKIPSEWLLPETLLSAKPRNVLPVFRSCGILTDRELEITEAKDATSVLEQIHSRNWSAKEVTVAFCKRAAIAQQLVNCLMDIDFEGAMRRAKELDEHLAKSGSVVGPLHGLPVSLKDLTDVKGMRIALGMVDFADSSSSSDAVAVQSLRAAGAVVYVKTTMPQTGMALETASNLFGRTLNPFNTSLVSGGSSGGEGALNGCLGAPLGIATDIGGSIRAPAAFNGLYGIRPTSRRFSYRGNAMGFTGQAAILSSIGPVGRSLRDIELILKIWNASEPWLVDPAVMAKLWQPVSVPSKTTIGVMYWDEVVMPHPPMQRTLKDAVEKLKQAGHEVIDFEPYKHKEAWDLAFRQYYPNGGKFVKDALTRTGEPTIPAVAKFLARAKELDCHEQNMCNQQQRQYQTEYLEHWNATASRTSTGKPVDAILTPSFASASYPHDHLPWWGYLSQWNLLDYPAIILPVGKVEPSDVPDTSYQPANDLDRENHELYDPELFAGAPLSLQLVGRSMFEEQLLATAMAVDQAINRRT
ncbi:putative amidase [Cyphellophora attinorum]|uniref:Putative amidase n=1 Tax=Cyphellophora attinorum TaxID=1664694 RepID=A0A0N1HLV9_9EURO|nr:putative amidase [Phialophora attinorum]KPI38100.1 putative amidase [Phialophora attinorum]